MKTRFIIPIIIFNCAFIVTLFGQDSEDWTPEVYESLEYVRIQKLNNSIKGLIPKDFHWSDYENLLSAEAKEAEIEKYIGVQPMNFYFPQGLEFDEPELIPIGTSEVHFLDYDGDGNNDIIYEQMNGMSVGHQVKFIKWREDKKAYVFDFMMDGRVVALNWVFKDPKQFNFTLHTYPCCDGYIQTIQEYSLDFKDSVTHITFNKKTTFVQSNLSREIQLPTSLDLSSEIQPSVSLEKDAVVYFKSEMALYNKVSVDPSFLIPGFQALGVLKMGSEINLLYLDKLAGGGNGMFLASVSDEKAFLKRLKFIDHRTGHEHTLNLIPKNHRFLFWVRYSDLKFRPTTSMAQQWNQLCLKGGCTTGGQYCDNGNFTGKSLFTNDMQWQVLMDNDQKKLTNFLIDEFDNQDSTRVHICPYSVATRGEVAVYLLQQMYKVNWYELSASYAKFKNVQSCDALNNHQIWLQEILANDKKREALIKNWRKYIQKSI